MRLTTVFAASFATAIVASGCSSSPTAAKTSPTGYAGTGGSDDAGACAKSPPTGAITLAAVADPAATHMGKMTSLVLDGNGDPMIAFSSQDRSGQLFFTRWDRCAGGFTKPAALDALGAGESVNDNVPLRQVSLARDAANGTLLIAYVKTVPAGANPTQAIWTAKSTDGGATWSKEQVSIHPADEAGDIHDAESPVATFADGKAWIAYGQDYVHCDATFSSDAPRCDGWLLSGDLGSWERQVVPRGSNGPMSESTLGIATDSAGEVAIAFVTNPDEGYDRVVEYWRPGTNPIAVFDSKDEQNDDPSVSLAFFGTKPRVAAHLIADTDADYDMMFSQSDDGVTWAPAVHVTRDATRVTAWYQSLAIDQKGNMAIVANDNGGTDATPKCGTPKIARSTDGVTWTTCGADPVPETGTSGNYVSAAYGPDGKLQLAFYNEDAGDKYGAGVLYWHE